MADISIPDGAAKRLRGYGYKPMEVIRSGISNGEGMSDDLEKKWLEAEVEALAHDAQSKGILGRLKDD